MKMSHSNVLVPKAVWVRLQVHNKTQVQLKMLTIKKCQEVEVARFNFHRRSGKIVQKISKTKSKSRRRVEFTWRRAFWKKRYEKVLNAFKWSKEAILKMNTEITQGLIQKKKKVKSRLVDLIHRTQKLLLKIQAIKLTSKLNPLWTSIKERIIRIKKTIKIQVKRNLLISIRKFQAFQDINILLRKIRRP